MTLLAAASRADLDTLTGVLLLVLVLASAAVTVWLLYRGAWVAALAGAVITALFAVFLL
jgi:hypothetical protein